MATWIQADRKGFIDATKLTVLHRMWDAIGRWIVHHYAIVGTACLLMMVVAALGIPKIRTSVQLLKLFDGKAKVITDYEWLEANIGRLVPMELVLAVEPEVLAEQRNVTAASPATADLRTEQSLTFLERIELSSRVRQVIEDEFGDGGRSIIGPGMSSDVMILPEALPPNDTGVERTRAVYNQTLLDYRESLLDQLDFFRVDTQDDRELWRISLRLGAFNDVDYGRFVADLMQAVEPVLAAYRTRSQILEQLYRNDDGSWKTTEELKKARVLLIGWQDRQLADADATTAEDNETQTVAVTGGDLTGSIDQTGIFCNSLKELLENRGFDFGGRGRGRNAYAGPHQRTTRRFAE